MLEIKQINYADTITGDLGTFILLINSKYYI